uniref:Uncharacterized protein LOC104239224 n=1 Tax=Nicotiana sylvestris TaxID=4096 RepID=A0A1U7XMI7_NICSY|nr:PREDICTED: uncharacterized protein LOC104239224 [Nicotiana sylvestris]
MTHHILLKWEPPTRSLYKLNTDRAARGNLGIGGLGGVFRSHNGDRILGYMDNIPHTTNTRAEVRALIRGLSIIHRMDNMVVRHIYREQNRVADALAEEAAKKIF